MSKDAKLVRGQVRQIVNEVLPEVLNSAIFAQLQKQVKDQLEQINALIRQRLDAMESRQKDVHSLLMRELLGNIPVAKEDKAQE